MGLFRSDRRGGIVYVNRRWRDITGLSEEQCMGDGWLRALHPKDADWVSAGWREFLAAPLEWHEEFRLIRPGGESRWVECRAVAERNARDEIAGFVGTIADITERHRSEQALEESERLFRHFFHHSNIGLAIIDPRGSWMRVNRQFCSQLGYRESELLGTSWENLTHPEDMAYDIAQFELLLQGKIPQFEQNKRFLRQDGSVLHTHLTLAGYRMSTGSVEFVIVSAQDIGEQLHLQAQLQHLALRDPLTGVYNRLELLRRLSEELARASRYERPVSAFLLDADHFRQINDNHGHSTGDAALRLLVQVLEQECRRSDYIARFGGEEFVVVLPETGPNEALELARRLCAKVRQSALELPDGKTLHLTVSIGVAAFPEHADDGEGLIEIADRAMYLAKRLGRDRVQLADAPAAPDS
jgi:diguanylate cyclase (GGDEF)-like protein/PAS domain S-box-containing protein